MYIYFICLSGIAQSLMLTYKTNLHMKRNVYTMRVCVYKRQIMPYCSQPAKNDNLLRNTYVIFTVLNQLMSLYSVFVYFLFYIVWNFNQHCVHTHRHWFSILQTVLDFFPIKKQGNKRKKKSSSCTLSFMFLTLSFCIFILYAMDIY